MNITEIKNQEWVIRNDLEVIRNDLASISIEEQELHVNVDRLTNMILVCCSDQRYITVLKKSKLFRLERVLVSSNPSNQGFVLEVLRMVMILFFVQSIYVER